MPDAAGASGLVLVVGDVVTDVTARLAEAPAPGSDTAASVRLGGGGAAANVACWLAAEGVEACLVARVGDDPAGRERVAELARAGVDARLTVDQRAPTGAIVVLVGQAGERTMYTDRGANRHLAPGDVPAGLVEAAAWLHLSGYVLLDPASRPAALAVLARARAAGTPVSVDPASSQPLRRAGASRVLDWVAGVGLMLPNADEAAVLTGRADPAEAAGALTAVAREAVVTLGAAGAVWSDGARAVRRPAAPAEVVDTTGAGDAFTAGFVAARLAGATPEASCEAACALAARAVARLGARPA